MRVQWATVSKAVAASDKHFNGTYTAAQMTAVATRVMRNATHVGVSDRSNGGYAPAKIVWGQLDGEAFAVVIDSKDIAKGIATIISFYDLNTKTINTKAKRFNMREIK